MSAQRVVAGGQHQHNPPGNNGSVTNTDGQAESDAPAVDEVTVQIASWQDVEKMVADHQGKVVVVDLWSSWCVPCIREFPNLVKLHQSRPDSIACISVNLNYDGSADAPPESHREAVLEFLVDQNATFVNVICSDADSDLYTQIDLASIPAIYVYDKAGKSRKRFDNDYSEYGDEGFTYHEHVIPLVEQLLAE